MSEHTLSTMTREAVEVGLREWARGLYPMEAGAELLIRSGLIHRGDVRRCCGPADPPSTVVWVDTDKLVDELDNGGIQVGMFTGSVGCSTSRCPCWTPGSRSRSRTCSPASTRTP